MRRCFRRRRIPDPIITRRGARLSICAEKNICQDANEDTHGLDGAGDGDLGVEALVKVVDFLGEKGDVAPVVVSAGGKEALEGC